MVIPVYHLEQLTALSTERTSIGVKRLEQGFKHKENIESSHRHNFYQIIWVTKGCGTHLIDFHAYPIQPATLYFLSPGQVHEWQMTEAVTGYIIAFTNELFSSTLQGKTTLSDLPYFYPINAHPLLYVGDEQATVFNTIIGRIESEYQASLVDREAMLTAFIQILLIEAKRIYDPHQSTHSIASGVLLTKQFLFLVEENFLLQTRVTEYAKQLSITANHLNETVKQTVGKTAGELIRDRLLLEAKRWLIHSDLSISEIAHDLNFEDPSYFCRFFKRYTHCSPKEFRQQGMTADDP
jgi:AraC-like DNA-binding protein